MRGHGKGQGRQFMAVIGEEISLEVDLYNPLAVQIHVDRLRISTQCSTSENNLQVLLSVLCDLVALDAQKGR